MTTFLLDANVAIALLVLDHDHHARASSWFVDQASLAVCPVAEGAVARFLLRVGESGDTVSAVLAGLRDHPRVDFWPDDLSYADVGLREVRGHRQATDVYLAALAAARGGRLATFDRGIATLRPEQTHLIP
ncbi:MAG: PIN domain-containing protein [Austwickia sp.]|jgi:uncharacterized protein|nr:MAG: PIN domain-containing protein [Austwickia sp.]